MIDTVLVNLSLMEENVGYIVACLGNDPSTLRHEWAHYLYYNDESYRVLVYTIWQELKADAKKAICKDLTLWNYNKEVFADEFQAYLAESPSVFGKKWSPYLYQWHAKFKSILPSQSTLSNLKAAATDTLKMHIFNDDQD